MSRPKPVPPMTAMTFMRCQLINKPFFSNYKRNMVRKTTMSARKVTIPHEEREDAATA